MIISVLNVYANEISLGTHHPNLAEPESYAVANYEESKQANNENHDVLSCYELPVFWSCLCHFEQGKA